MNDSQWDAKLKAFLKKTGDDFKRFGNDVKVEAEKLLTEVQDPKRQEKLREGLKDVGVWAKKTAEEVATLVETGVKKAEGALGKASEKVNDFVSRPVEQAPEAKPEVKTAPPPPAATPPSPPPVMEEAKEETEEEAAPARPKKTVGKSAGKSVGKQAPAKKKSPAKKAPARKTIGKKSSAG